MEAACIRPRAFVIAVSALLIVMASTWGDFAVSQAQMRDAIKPVKIVQIYGRDTLQTGELETFRVRVNAPYATAYSWRISDGTELGGNPIVYRFDQPGLYSLIATARNPAGTSVDTLMVVVLGERRPPPVAAKQPVEAGKSKGSKDTPSTTAKKPPSGTGQTPKATPVTLKESTQGSYTWVIGTYFLRSRADAVANSYRAVGFRSSVFVDSGGKGSTVFRVTLGRFDTEQKALEAKGELKTYGIANPLLHHFGGA